MIIKIDEHEFLVEFEVDQEIESRELIVEILEIKFFKVDVTDIISTELYNKIEDEIYRNL